MQYKALVLDIDGTLLAHKETAIRPEVAAAVRSVKQLGVAVVIATGRSHFAVPQKIVSAIQPDYILCANGAQLVNKRGRTVFCHRFLPEEMYALVDYFEDYDAPLAFCFEDKYHVYVEYEAMVKCAPGYEAFLANGQDQNRHLQSMPFGGFAMLPAELLAGFHSRYGHLGLQLVPIRPGSYDVVQAGVNKAMGMQALLEKSGIAADQLVFIGDNDNDREAMAMAGLSYCMENGSELAKAAAHRIAPSVYENGVAAAIKEVFFAHEPHEL